MFRFNGMEYQYDISFHKGKIVNENLYYKEIGTKQVIVVFERNEKECIVGEDIQFISFKKIKNTLPLLSYIASLYDIPVVDSALAWFMSIHIMDYNLPSLDYQIQFPKQEHEKTVFFRMLHEMVIDISDVRIEKDTDGNIKNIYCKHMVNGETIELPIQEESSGSKKIFTCLSKIYQCLENGYVLLADELDAKLHPKLLQYIISLFTSPNINKSGAQLLITSHDMVNMNPSVFRRDEIWFTSLSPDHASSLYSLIAFKEENGKPPRKDAVYGKRYLEGKYGADPYIKKGMD